MSQEELADRAGLHRTYVSDVERGQLDEFIALCPGIRPSGGAHGDQRRVATPRDAHLASADYIVVGRPIVEDNDPAAAAQAILAELN